MSIEELRARDIIIFECLSGSHAYGLATPTSDEDIKGVFILPKVDYYGLNYVEQVSDATNDTVYYELKRFVELLARSNPNMLEMLYTPDDSVLKIHPLFKRLREMDLLSKQCKESFGGYAMTQVRKAKGLNKKILNPVERDRKSVLDFCFVAQGQGSIPVIDFLNKNGINQTECGVANIPHMHEVYGLYQGPGEFRGIVSGSEANDITLSSIPSGLAPVAILSFNKSGYSKHCKEYKEYWEWAEKRNDVRYQNTLQHGKNYDAKNMMHTFRLLTMCEEIGREGKLHVRRHDREYLLSIETGEFQYDDLLQRAEEKIGEIEVAYATSALPEFPDVAELNRALVDMRDQFYRNR
ncbi:MAG: DNA polymerase beta superfamily protein [Imperialibacter sp.]|uniref:nucleotidyltransferase domain-containing protein n=1 Tax=Imperialibacter sp. TaxID=2038411 RepID=UPI003A88A3AE